MQESESDAGKTLALLRAAADISINELAAASGVSRQTISKIESGKPSRLRTLAKLMHAVGPGDNPSDHRGKLYTKMAMEIGLEGDDGVQSGTLRDADANQADIVSLLTDFEHLTESVTALSDAQLSEMPPEVANRLVQNAQAVVGRVLAFRQNMFGDVEGPLISTKV